MDSIQEDMQESVRRLSRDFRIRDPKATGTLPREQFTAVLLRHDAPLAQVDILCTQFPGQTTGTVDYRAFVDHMARLADGADHTASPLGKSPSPMKLAPAVSAGGQPSPKHHRRGHDKPESRPHHVQRMQTVSPLGVSPSPKRSQARDESREGASHVPLFAAAPPQPPQVMPAAAAKPTATGSVLAQHHHRAGTQRGETAASFLDRVARHAAVVERASSVERSVRRSVSSGRCEPASLEAPPASFDNGFFGASEPTGRNGVRRNYPDENARMDATGASTVSSRGHSEHDDEEGWEPSPSHVSQGKPISPPKQGRSNARTAAAPTQQPTPLPARENPSELGALRRVALVGVFRLVDSDGDGFVSADDIGLAFSARGVPAVTQDGIDALFGTIADGNNGGFVGYAGFCSFVARLPPAAIDAVRSADTWPELAAGNATGAAAATAEFGESPPARAAPPSAASAGTPHLQRHQRAQKVQPHQQRHDPNQPPLVAASYAARHAATAAAAVLTTTPAKRAGPSVGARAVQSSATPKANPAAVLTRHPQQRQTHRDDLESAAVEYRPAVSRLPPQATVSRGVPSFARPTAATVARGIHPPPAAAAAAAPSTSTHRDSDWIVPPGAADEYESNGDDQREGEFGTQSQKVPTALPRTPSRATARVAASVATEDGTSVTHRSGQPAAKRTTTPAAKTAVPTERVRLEARKPLAGVAVDKDKHQAGRASGPAFDDADYRDERDPNTTSEDGEVGHHGWRDQYRCDRGVAEDGDFDEEHAGDGVSAKQRILREAAARFGGKCSQLLALCSQVDRRHGGRLQPGQLRRVLATVDPALPEHLLMGLVHVATCESSGTCDYVQLVGDLIACDEEDESEESHPKPPTCFQGNQRRWNSSDESTRRDSLAPFELMTQASHGNAHTQSNGRERQTRLLEQPPVQQLAWPPPPRPSTRSDDVEDGHARFAPSLRASATTRLPSVSDDFVMHEAAAFAASSSVTPATPARRGDGHTGLGASTTTTPRAAANRGALTARPTNIAPGSGKQVQVSHAFANHGGGGGDRHPPSPLAAAYFGRRSPPQSVERTEPTEYHQQFHDGIGGASSGIGEDASIASLQALLDALRPEFRALCNGDVRLLLEQFVVNDLVHSGYLETPLFCRSLTQMFRSAAARNHGSSGLRSRATAGLPQWKADACVRIARTPFAPTTSASSAVFGPMERTARLAAAKLPRSQWRKELCDYRFLLHVMLPQ